MTDSTEDRRSSAIATCVVCRVDFLSSEGRRDHDHISGTPLTSTAKLAEVAQPVDRNRSVAVR